LVSESVTDNLVRLQIILRIIHNEKEWKWRKRTFLPDY
jgi:hypothetical protein